jgi:hypothetical protein
MKLLVFAASIVFGSLAGPAAPPQNLCVPPPVRITPHSLYEPVDKWQFDQRTIA